MLSRTYPKHEILLLNLPESAKSAHDGQIQAGSDRLAHPVRDAERRANYKCRAGAAGGHLAAALSQTGQGARGAGADQRLPGPAQWRRAWIRAYDVRHGP